MTPTLDQSPFAGDDLLWRQLKTIPAFRAVLRAVEARFYASIALPAPVLDVGCGDGHFSQMTFTRRLQAGIDPWWNPLKKSADTGMYDILTQARGDRLPFPSGAFASAFSNSVLEHIPDIQPVLNEVNRVLQPDGRFLMTMPSHYFTAWLGGAAFFEALGAHNTADWYRRRFNGISRHAHTDPPDVWAERLALAGFEVERWQYYFSKEALRALEIGHLQGLPSAVMHLLTGHWIVAPWESSLQRTEQWLRPFYNEPFGDEGAYLLIVARKKADGPISAALPPAQPFAVSALNSQWAAVNGQQPTEDKEALPLPADMELHAPLTPTNTTSPPHRPPHRSGSRLPFMLTGLSLLFAFLGQAALNGAAAGSTSGLGWFGLAALPLAILAWRARPTGDGAGWRWPHIGDIPERRWWFAPALLLAVLAYRLTAVPGNERPTLALLLWLVAIALGFFALSIPLTDNRLPFVAHHSRTTLMTALVLGLTAVALRFINLSQQPFVLSGIEASLGLNAVEIINGQLRHPFGTAWLTNPTLPLYLTAVPIRLFGQTVWALRFLSPLVGGLTVAATYIIGQRLYGRAVGLTAAILLLGSHLHLHYSRLGLTNIWGPLLVLLALGLTAVAWERGPNAPGQRPLWLAAGLVIGLNAYEFSSARLLPLMLLALLAWALLAARPTLRAQGAHLLAALALALLVALPPMLFYRDHDTIFGERAAALGILDGQTDWLRQQANATGQSQAAIFRQQFWRAALAFNGGEDLSPLYKPNAPLLGFGTAILFSLGFLMALFRLRQGAYALLPVWLLVTILFAGALLIDPPQSHRLFIALPAVMLLAATALVEIGRRTAAVFTPAAASAPNASPYGARTQSARLLLVMAAMAAVLAFSEVAFYYGRYPQINEFADANTEAAHRIADYLNTLDGEWAAYFYGPPVMYVDFPTFPYLLTDFRKGVNFFDVNQSLPEVAAPVPNQVFIFVPERAGDVTAVQTHFPGGVLEGINGRYRSPLFLVYTVPSP